MHKQTALLLLRVALLPCFNHLLRAHDPSVSTEGANLFDKAIMAAYMEITRSWDLLNPLYAHNAAQLYLPIRLGGQGFTSAAATAPSAAAAAIAAAPADPPLCPRPAPPSAPAPSGPPPAPHPNWPWQLVDMAGRSTQATQARLVV